VNPLVLPLEPARHGPPNIVDTGDISGAEEILLDETNRVLDALYAYSYNPFYTHHFFVRTFPE